MNMQNNLGRNIPQPQGMPPGMPQGIASLQGMQRPQQPPQQQGPQGLQNIPQDLQNLTAAQAALSAAQQAKQVYEQALRAAADRNNAMNAQIPQGTIAEQIQTQLSDIAKQAAGVAKKQASDHQEAMQRLAQAAQGGSPLMSGIAQAPGAGQVMPARMASGGIVAFQNRGEVPPVVDPREVQRILRKSPMARTPEENEILRQSGIKLEQRRMGPEGIVQRAERGLQQIGPAARQYLTEGAAGLSPEELEQRGDTGAITEKIYRMLGGQQARPPASGMSEADLQDLMPTRQPLPKTPLPPEMGIERPPQAPPSVAGPGLRGAAVKPPGIAGALEKPVLPPDSAGQGISPPALTARPELEAPFTKAAQGIFSRDPEAMARAAQERYGAAMDPAEAERRKVLDQIIGQRRAALEGMPDARERNLQRLFAGLRNVGTGGRSGLGGFAEASQAQARGYQQQQQKYQEELNKLLMGEANRGVDVAGKRYGVGEEARAGVGADIRAAMSPVGSVVSSQLGAQSAAEDRASQERRLERQIAAQRELKQMEIDNPEWKSKLEYAMRNPQAAALMFPKGDKAALDYLKLQVDLKQSQMQALANDLSPDAAERKKVLAAEVATLSRALGELSGVSLSQPRPSAPAVGTVMQGYRFKGGDPSDRKNWEKV